MDFKGRTDNTWVYAAQSETGLLAYVDHKEKDVISFFGYDKEKEKSVPPTEKQIAKLKKFGYEPMK
jgi:hypothetical protein